MSMTYSTESYESGPLSVTTEYKLSDGSRWVRIVEEYIAPDMKVRKRTRVLRSDFPGDKEHRDTLTNLQGAIANADLIMYAEPSSAPVKLDPTEVWGAVRVSDPGPEDAPTDEVLDVQFLGINADKSMSWCVTFADRVLQTVRAETRDEAIAAAIAGREADGLNQPMLPAFVIEPGYEEQAHPMTRRQEAVLLAVSAELELTAPMDVIPPLEKLGDISASLGEGGSRVALDIDAEGFLDGVRVRITVGGESEWLVLSPGSGSKYFGRVMDAARVGRRTVKPEDNNLLPR